jgi:hypothetical protein
MRPLNWCSELDHVRPEGKMIGMKATKLSARNLINRWSLRRGFVPALGVGLVIGFVSVVTNSARGQGSADIRPAMLASGGDSVAACLHYPPKAKAKKDEAAIPFYCEVGPNGKAAFISLFGPEDKTEFRAALMKALSQGRFQPAMSGGKAVPVLLGGTAFFMFRDNAPIIAISLSTADKEKTAALGNYIQPQMLSSDFQFRRKLWHGQHDPDIHPLMGASPVHPGAAVLAQIDAQGNVVSTKIVAESRPGAGYGALLLKAFQGAKFIPAFSDGEPVAGQFDMIANYDKMQDPNSEPSDTHIKRDFTNW